MRRALSSAGRHSVGVGARLRFLSTLAPAPAPTPAANANDNANSINANTTNAKSTSTNITNANAVHTRPHKPPFVRRLREPQPLSASKPRARLRVANARVGALLASRTTPSEFVTLCDELRTESDVALLAGTDSKAWNVALQNRLKQDDARGARALLELLLGFHAENASEQLWTDLLFTLLRQRAHFSSENDLSAILSALRRPCGDEFVARVAVSLVNGCANIKMFDEARFMIRFHRSLGVSTVVMPPRILGNLVSTMQAKRHFQSVIELTDEVLAEQPLAQVQPQLWIALFRSCAQTPTADLARRVDRFIAWFHAVHDRRSTDSHDSPQLERVLGAVVQSCVVSGNERLALRVFHALTHEDEEERETATIRRVHPDENIYVNVLKACRVLLDDSFFRDVYRRMVSDGVARSAGFGSAIRFCHAHHDVVFLEEVLDDAFAVEDTQRQSGKQKKGWFLPLEQYNDALGCLAETKSFDRAKDLFARLLENPRVTPDHITMVEMVESYREAPFADVFELMDVFLELQLTPNMHVFTSLLAACGRHRLMNDALALVDAMRRQGVTLDVKAFTALGFVYGVHGHVAGIVDMLQDMQTQGVLTDTKFFDVVLDGLYVANGIDMCFALFRETLDAGLRIPAGMYASLIGIGTKVGLIERTLHVAYNMECDGIPLTSSQLLGLIHQCEANAEVAELVRTFLLLHQGRELETDADARFSQDVYEEMVALLTTFSQRDAIARVKQLAQAAGYDLV